MLYTPYTNYLMSLALSWVFILSIGISSGCKKDKTSAKITIPASVETSSLAFISPVSILITGNITNEESQEIIDHGFIYGYTTDIDLLKGTKISHGKPSRSGFFTSIFEDVHMPADPGTKFRVYAKAYITDNNGTRYGELKSSYYADQFLTRNVEPGGKAGDQVTIEGNFKSISAEQIKVRFATINAKIITKTESYITVEVPKGIPFAHGQTVPIILNIGAHSSTATLAFSIDANFTDFFPKSGPIGTKITFTGDNLPASQYATHMYLDDKNADQHYEKEFYIKVPSNVNNEHTRLYYSTSRNYITSLPFEFKITPPIIKSITPNPVLEHELVTLHMENLLVDVVGNEPLVKIGHFATYVTPDQNGNLAFNLEGSPVQGQSYPVTVIYGPHTIISPFPVTIIKPKASGFSPNAGYPGTEVRITGKFAKDANYVVNIVGYTGVFGKAVSNTELVFNMPAGIRDETYSLSIKQSPEDVPVPGRFQGRKTRFDLVSPQYGPPGTEFIVSGEGILLNDQDIYSLNFGGPIAQSIQESSFKIKIVVPKQSPPGTYPIKFNSVDTGLFFTVTN